MVFLHRLNRTEFLLNADLIETVEATPDTVVTLTDGKKFVVSDTPREVYERIVAFHADISNTAARRAEAALEAEASRPPAA